MWQFRPGECLETRYGSPTSMRQRQGTSPSSSTKHGSGEEATKRKPRRSRVSLAHDPGRDWNQFMWHTGWTVGLRCKRSHVLFCCWTLLDAIVRNGMIATWSSLRASFEVNICPISKTNTPLQRYCNGLNEDGLLSKIQQEMIPSRSFKVSQRINVLIDWPWCWWCRPKRELFYGDHHA